MRRGGAAGASGGPGRCRAPRRSLAAPLRALASHRPRASALPSPGGPAPALPRLPPFPFPPFPTHTQTPNKTPKLHPSLPSRAGRAARREAAEAQQRLAHAGHAAGAAGLRAELRGLQASLQAAALERERGAVAGAIAARERAPRGADGRSGEGAAWLDPPSDFGGGRPAQGSCAGAATPHASPACSAPGATPFGHSVLALRTAALLGARSAMERGSPPRARHGGLSAGAGNGWPAQSPRGVQAAASPRSIPSDYRSGLAGGGGDGFGGRQEGWHAGGAHAGCGGCGAHAAAAAGWDAASTPAWTPGRPDAAGGYTPRGMMPVVPPAPPGADYAANQQPYYYR